MFRGERTHCRLPAGPRVGVKEENLHGSVCDLHTPDPACTGRLLCFRGYGCRVPVGAAEMGFSVTHRCLKSTFLSGPKQNPGQWQQRLVQSRAGTEPATRPSPPGLHSDLLWVACGRVQTKHCMEIVGCVYAPQTFQIA